MKWLFLRADNTFLLNTNWPKPTFPKGWLGSVFCYLGSHRWRKWSLLDTDIHRSRASCYTLRYRDTPLGPRTRQSLTRKTCRWINDNLHHFTNHRKKKSIKHLCYIDYTLILKRPIKIHNIKGICIEIQLPIQMPSGPGRNPGSHTQI
jgi:hypothetical protein